MIYHFKKGIIKEEPAVWFMLSPYEEDVPYTFATKHYIAAGQLTELGFATKIMDYTNNNDRVHQIIGIYFDEVADEAEFILKYSDGIDIVL